MIVLILPASVTAAQSPVNLGTTESFAVLAGTTITNTGTTTINGDAGGNVGLFPGTAFTGQETATISGAIHLNNDVASKAKDDLVIAYDDAADGTFQITGTLTLDADGDPEGVFIFLTSSTLITASDSNTITPAGDTTETTITKTGEASNSAFMVIGPIMLCLAGIIFLALQISQKRAGTVMPNSDYRASDRKK